MAQLARNVRAFHAPHGTMTHNPCIESRRAHDMTTPDPLDAHDRRILSALQGDGRLTNHELAERVGLSASQCSRRRRRLERGGVIRGYHAHLDRERAGFGLVSLISVTLAAHDADNARRFAELIEALPNVLEAHSLTGESDYLVKVVTPDLRALSSFVAETLLPHAAVQNVRTAIVLDTLKESRALPVG